MPASNIESQVSAFKYDLFKIASPGIGLLLGKAVIPTFSAAC